jgi:hypothetical protein
LPPLRYEHIEEDLRLGRRACLPGIFFHMRLIAGGGKPSVLTSNLLLRALEAERGQALLPYL